MKNSVERWSSDIQGLFRVKIRKMALGSNDLSTLPLSLNKNKKKKIVNSYVYPFSRSCTKKMSRAREHISFVCWKSLQWAVFVKRLVETRPVRKLNKKKRVSPKVKIEFEAFDSRPWTQGKPVGAFDWSRFRRFHRFLELMHSINLDFILLTQICKSMKSSKSSPRARFQPDFFDFLCAGNLKAEPEGWKQQWWSNALRIVVCSRPRLALTSSCLDCRHGRSKHIYYACWKARAMSRAFSPGLRQKKFARGKAMARRRLQRRCETKGRRLKTTHAPGVGRFMTS